MGTVNYLINMNKKQAFILGKSIMSNELAYNDPFTIFLSSLLDVMEEIYFHLPKETRTKLGVDIASRVENTIGLSNNIGLTDRDPNFEKYADYTVVGSVDETDSRIGKPLFSIKFEKPFNFYRTGAKYKSSCGTLVQPKINLVPAIHVVDGVLQMNTQEKPATYTGILEFQEGDYYFTEQNCEPLLYENHEPVVEKVDKCSNNLETHYLEYECQSRQRTLCFVVDPVKESIYTEVHLTNRKYWYQRVWAALKYVFGIGHWDCTLLDKEGINKLRNILDKASPRKV